MTFTPRLHIILITLYSIPFFINTPAQAAHPISWVLDVSAGSLAIDEGSARANAYTDIGVTASRLIGDSTYSASAYMIAPQGDGRDVFDDEMELSLGLEKDIALGGFAAAATWVSPPNKTSQGALELTAGLAFDALFAPEVDARYNFPDKEYAITASAGPEWAAGDWTLGARGHIGMVHPDGAEHRSFGGINLTAAYPLSDAAEVGLFAQSYTSDTNDFVSKIENGMVTKFGNSGHAIGVTLSVAP